MVMLLFAFLETLKSIAESEKEQVRLMEQQRKDAMEDAKRQKRFFYISTAISVTEITVAIIVCAFPRV
jgi:hypothetical protein